MKIGRGHIEEIEARQLGGHVEVRFEERTDRSDVLPIALKDVGEHAARFDRAGNDVLAEIRERIVEQLAHDFPAEHVNAHRGQKQILPRRDVQVGIPFRRQLQRILQRRILRLLHEARDPPFRVDLQDPERLRLAARNGNRRDGDVRAGLRVLLDDLAEIHPIQLIAAQDQQVVEVMIQKVNEIFAHRVGRALIPRCVGVSLFGREDFHEAAGKMIELVRLRDVAVQ